MALTRPNSDFVTSTISGAIDADDTTITIGTGLSIPATNSYLQLDYASTEAVGAANGPETIFYAAYNTATGALTGVVRGQAGTTGVAHENGAKVQCGMSTAFLEPFVGAKAYLAASQLNLVNVTWTKILLDTEDYDYGANFASNKFVAPVDGLYQVDASVIWLCTAAGYFDGAIFKNGAAILQNSSYGAASTNSSNTLSTPVLLDKDDYIELYARSHSGNDTSDVVGTDESYTNMAVSLIKEA